MATALRMPQLGESVVEGTVGKWLKSVGERVDEHEPLLEVVTDKVDSEITSPGSGYVLQLYAEEGETVQAGRLLAYIGEKDEPIPEPGSPEALEIIVPHGIEAIREAEPTPESVSPPGEEAPLPRPVGEPGELLRLTPMRKAIAEHMVRSIHTSPHTSTVFEVDASRIVAHRAANRADFAQKGVKLTFTPYFVLAAVEALKAVPVVNSTFTDEGIQIQQEINIGVAVAVDEGLIVPVIKGSNEKPLRDVAREVNDLAHRARTKQLKPDEVHGGTFTVTNHGVSGSLVTLPIINQPQAAILGVGMIQKRVIVTDDDAIAIRPMQYLSLTFDHRILDGATADRFMMVLKQALQTWT